MATPRRMLQIGLLLVSMGLAVWWQGRNEHGADTGTTPASSSRLEVPHAPAPATSAVIPTPEKPRYDLGRDESRGGHTLERHVGKTDEELLARLERERGISAASTYTNRAVAEITVARVLDRYADRVAAWAARQGPRPNLALTYRGATEVLGRTFERGARSAEPSTDAIVVLRGSGQGDYYVLTSYPEGSR